MSNNKKIIKEAKNVLRAIHNSFIENLKKEANVLDAQYADHLKEVIYIDLHFEPFFNMVLQEKVFQDKLAFKNLCENYPSYLMNLVETAIKNGINLIKPVARNS